MITVVGINTAIDHLMRVDTLHLGEVNRTVHEQVLPGGKGLHVAQTIAALGEPVQLIGLIDTAHRNLTARRMSERGVLFHGVEIDAPLRHCIALQDADGRITEVLGQGPQLGERDRAALQRAFRLALAESELVILSGSLPRGLPVDTYAELAQQVHAAGKRCLIDASGEVLRQAVAAQPFLLKPNRDEAEALFGRSVGDLDAAVTALRELAARGVAMPVLSLGAQGALGMDDSGVWHAAVELEQVRNTVGSGDCFLAGMAVAIRRREPLREALRLAVACGAANAMDVETGYVRPDQVEALLGRVRVREWKH
ncbi:MULTISPECIES: 1-phosphofructokinase family hexose kinase [unclassified Rhodanobacter]|uniref:Phosphofructokinase n=1 Tax=Rhodanobacter humi TaxID=1888173 RepID=A0ABV4AVV5_9GAMM